MFLKKFFIVLMHIIRIICAVLFIIFLDISQGQEHNINSTIFFAVLIVGFIVSHLAIRRYNKREHYNFYSDQLKPLRDRIRKEKGYINCLRCNQLIKIELKNIEKKIFRAIKYSKVPINELKTDRPNRTDEFAVCLNCKNVLCGDCLDKAYERSLGLRASQVFCPKCDQPLYSYTAIIN